MKPHGLDLIMKEELLENEKVVYSSNGHKNSFEGWIHIKNKKNGKEAEFPMRSFVSTFISRIHGILSGDGGTDTRIKSASSGVGASLARHQGIVIGTGTTPPKLSDTVIETLASDASLAYSTTTFEHPESDGGSPPTIMSEIRRLIQNNKNSAFYINEMVTYGKNVISAVSGAATGRLLYSRDVITGTSAGVPFAFSADSDVRFDFKFKVTQGATGGLNTNFSRLIHNLFFKGSVNPPGSQIAAFYDTNPTYTFGNVSLAASNMFPFINGNAVQQFWGIVIGEDELTTTDPPSPNATGIDSVKVTSFTSSANTISSVTASGGRASFTISRTFTNILTNAVRINRIGILCKGVATTGVSHAVAGASHGTELHNDQFFITLNMPTGGSIDIQPNQTYRITYTVQIQV